MAYEKDENPIVYLKIDNMVTEIFDKFVRETSNFRDLKHAVENMGAYNVSWDECEKLIKEGIKAGLTQKAENIKRLLSEAQAPLGAEATEYPPEHGKSHLPCPKGQTLPTGAEGKA